MIIMTAVPFGSGPWDREMVNAWCTPRRGAKLEFHAAAPG
jgi:hypothetical protein